MKRLFINIAKTLVCMSAALPALVSCEEPLEKVEPVDLRYDAADSYNISATDAETISFVVKSTSPWEVSSYNADWCEIDPATGPSGEKFTVNVNYKDNTGLDDRIDTLVIKSGYWTGKWVQVIQKGIAYLTIEEFEGELSDAGGSGEILVKANQKWTAEVVEGSDWLTIDSGASGELDGKIGFSASENKGERRIGIISVKDRHSVEMYRTEVIQAGVRLDPDSFDLRVLYDQNSITLNVISNAVWTVSKNNPDDEWFSFSETSFEGNGSVNITVERNNSTTDIRMSEITLATVAEGDVQPVVRTVVIRQAFDNSPITYKFDATEFSKWNVNNGSAKVGPDGVTFTAGRITRNLPTGDYTFNIKSMSGDAMAVIFFTKGAQEARWHLNAETKKTNISTTPYSDVKQVSFDPSVPNAQGFYMTPTDDGFMKLEWALNESVFFTIENTGTKLTNFLWPSDFFVYLGCNKGTVVYESYTYQAPIIWPELDRQ